VPSCFTCRASDHTQHTRLQRFSSVFREKYTDVKILGLLIKLSSCHFNNHVEYAAVLAPYTDLKFGMVTVLQKKNSHGKPVWPNTASSAVPFHLFYISCGAIITDKYVQIAMGCWENM
jgi:hypothetical protein